MKWTEAEPDAQPKSFGAISVELPLGELLTLVTAAQPHVWFTEETWQGIYQHLTSSHLEQGGLLIGTAYQYSRREHIALIKVSAFTPAPFAESSPASLEMGTELWSVAQQRSSAGELIVGWYHSHPNLGAFFSGTDRRTQRAFFREPYSVGLVIDPVRREAKLFLAGDSNELAPSSVRIVGS